jgi:hypothetical protein
MRKFGHPTVTCNSRNSTMEQRDIIPTLRRRDEIPGDFKL